MIFQITYIPCAPFTSSLANLSVQFSETGISRIFMLSIHSVTFTCTYLSISCWFWPASIDKNLSDLRRAEISEEGRLDRRILTRPLASCNRVLIKFRKLVRRVVSHSSIASIQIVVVPWSASCKSKLLVSTYERSAPLSASSCDWRYFCFTTPRIGIPGPGRDYCLRMHRTRASGSLSLQSCVFSEQ